MDTLKPYIDGVNAASARSRTALYVMIVASTLIGASAWNYREGSWDNRHIQVVHFAARHLGEQLPPAENEELYAKAREYVGLLGWNWEPIDEHKASLKQLHAQLREQQHDKYGQIKVPIIGVAFNPNDTGLIGGFALAVFLMVLRLSLARENDTLQTTIERAAEEKLLRPVYDVLRMSQVLSSPPQSTENPSLVSNAIWNSLHKSLFALPAIVQLFVVVVDFDTLSHGWVVCRLNTIVELAGGICFFVLIVLLTVSCFRVSRATDQCWNDVYEAEFGSAADEEA